MTRPIYETAGHRADEARVMQIVAAKWNVETVKLRREDRLDFALRRYGKIVAYAEIKCRKYTREELERYGGFFMSKHKWVTARDHCLVTSTPFALIISFAGEVRAAVFKPPEFPALVERTGGRWDRGDKQDVETVVLFPGALFTYTFT